MTRPLNTYSLLTLYHRSLDQLMKSQKDQVPVISFSLTGSWMGCRDTFLGVSGLFEIAAGPGVDAIIRGLACTS